MTARYAIYFAPERDTALWRFGCGVHGRDPETDEVVPQIVPEGFSPQDWQGFTSSPRRYGFHATLKAPFALAEGKSGDELFAAVRARAAHTAPVTGVKLVPSVMGQYVMLGLAKPDPRVSALADAAVAEFDAFRAPPSAGEMARRAASGLSPREAGNLHRWGYPYVFDTFAFHMTLAGPLPKARTQDALAALRAGYDAAIGGEGVDIRALSVFVEPARGEPFRLLLRVPLEG